MRLSDIEEQVAGYDAALKPITGRPVENFDPEYFRNSDPLAEAGIRTEAVALLRTMLDVYAHGDDADRAAIRTMFERYGSFRTWVNLPWEPTAESFRLHLLHISARDLVPDVRDELVAVPYTRERAKAAGVDLRPIAREIAAISSDVNRFGMGSARDLLLAYAV
jgi:hypothetical protein